MVQVGAFSGDLFEFILDVAGKLGVVGQAEIEEAHWSAVDDDIDQELIVEGPVVVQLGG